MKSSVLFSRRRRVPVAIIFAALVAGGGRVLDPHSADGHCAAGNSNRTDADTSGFNFWLGKLNTFNGNFQNAEMVKAFISSSEYRQRFGPT